MITEKRKLLKPIIDSHGGTHLTAYLRNEGNLLYLKSQLTQILYEAHQTLYSAMSPEEAKKFLEPLEKLAEDPRVLKSMNGNIGIFRTSRFFRVINVHTEVKRQCHVADSFHVKPLLRWMQNDKDFLLLGINRESAHLYYGDQRSVRKVDTIILPNFFKTELEDARKKGSGKTKELLSKYEQTFSWLGNWIDQLTSKSSPKLFFAGEDFLVKGIQSYLNYKNIQKLTVAPTFGALNLTKVLNDIRGYLKIEAHESVQNALATFESAEKTPLSTENIFSIARAAISGRIKTVLVSEDAAIFGIIDRKSGKISLHPADLNHVDDDLLDDIAQLTLAAGSEALILPQEMMPNGAPILALLEPQVNEMIKKLGVEKSPILSEERIAI